MIEVRDLSVTYKGFKALKNVNIKIERGETLALVGQNGAGKSSLLRVLIGLVKSFTGSYVVEGNIGWMPELSLPDGKLSVREFISFSGYLKNLNKKQISNSVDSIIELCGLSNKKNDLCATLSKGLKQRVILAAALMGDPDVLILDEPSSGLDPLFQTQMISLISSINIDKTLIISTHNISEIEKLSSRVVVLKDGIVSFDSSKESRGDKSYYEYF